MIRATEGDLRGLASEAAHISALAEMMAVALQADPGTVIAGEAAEGLALIVRRLSDRLSELADPAD